MRKSHKGHQHSLAASVAAGAAILALVLSPVSAAYLFQANVMGQGFGGGMQGPGGNNMQQGPSFGGGMQGPGGPSFGGQMGGPNVKNEIAKAEKAAALFAAVVYDSTKCQLVSDLSLRYDETRNNLADVSDSLDLLDPQDDATEFKDLKSQMATLKKDLSALKRDKSKATSACKKELKKIEKVQKSIRSLPLNDIDGAMELMADMQACSAFTRPQPMGGFNGPQMGPQPMDNRMNDDSERPEGDCSNVAASLSATTAGLSTFVNDRNDSLADEEAMNQDFNTVPPAQTSKEEDQQGMMKKKQMMPTAPFQMNQNQNQMMDPNMFNAAPTSTDYKKFDGMDFNKYGITTPQTMPGTFMPQGTQFMPPPTGTQPQPYMPPQGTQFIPPPTGTQPQPYMPPQGTQFIPPPQGNTGVTTAPVNNPQP